MIVHCIICKKMPNEIAEYVRAAKEWWLQPMTPEQYVIEEEGTYNPANGHFYCTGCYVAVGMPKGVAP